ncbi:hypothetical protein [Dactylosporangium sp. NPDC051541]|uniref:hypothetical protein n=1 Tax=Dactylosporangium sp. NPDC051541 TaxID=3363977 RepID=UPI0037A51CA9
MTGLFAGALLSGLLAGVLGGFAAVAPDAWRWAAFAVLAVVVLAFELAGRPLRLPQNSRAVPQTIIPESNASGPLQFGFEMGTGVRTFMPTALPHALLAAVVLVGGILPGIGAGLGFGLGRALMPLVRAGSADPRGWDRRLLLSLRRIGILCAAAFALTLAAFALHRWGPPGWR